MYFEAAARSLYREGKSVIDATRDLAAVDDLIRWAREDLDEALLDLKLALMEQDDDEIDQRAAESVDLIREIRERFQTLRGES